jgi:hypothetical protein
MEVANLNLSKSFDLDDGDCYDELANIIEKCRLAFPGTLSRGGH